jgi:hypothetical protein
LAETIPGSIVQSKAGKDKGRFLAVTALEGGYAWVADGRSRPIGRPKRKKLKHLQPTRHRVEGMEEILSLPSADAQLRKILGGFGKPTNTEGEYFE